MKPISAAGAAAWAIFMASAPVNAKVNLERNMKTTKLAAATLALSLFASLTAVAQDAMVKGEVKKIDEAAGKITLKHGPIKNLDMDEDGMTMVFRVKDPDMLKQVKTGDKVQFEADRAPNGITIMKLQKGK